MKQSIYSHQFINDDKFYLYNSETKWFVQISERLYRILYNREYSLLDNQTLQELLKNKYLVQDENIYNYYYEQKLKYSSGCYNERHMTLVLVPTTCCNFTCPYCFEGEKQVATMSDEIVTGLISFINECKKLETLSIVWYGGEPLLAFDRIKYILGRLKEETEVKITRQSVISNGYLLNDEILDFFLNENINSMQITLDGIKENHDKTRFIGKKAEISTYDKIISNIGKVLTYLPDCHLSVRVNINNNNLEDFASLYTSLHEKHSSKNLYVYPGFIREETEDGISMCYDSLFDWNARLSFYESMREKGVHIDFNPPHVSKGCMANCINSYIIGPKGEIYKCWNDVNHPEKVIGNIASKDFVNKELFYAYQEETSPFNDPKCKECIAFPICSGGCVWYRYKNLKQGKDFNICTLFSDRALLERSLINSLEKKNENLPKINIC